MPAPVRKTPTFDEFKAIVASIREQKYSDTAEESADLVEFLGLSGLDLAEARAFNLSADVISAHVGDSYQIERAVVNIYLKFSAIHRNFPPNRSI